jgi:biofilm PGA synthesis protein PgaD
VRLRDWAVTLAMWAAYVWLIPDSFIRTGEAIIAVIRQDLRSEGLAPIFELVDTLGSYVVMVILNGAVLVAWARYNQFRFRGRERRKFVAPVTVSDFASFYGFPASQIADWQEARILTIDHDKEGRLTRVLARESGEPERREARGG